MILIYYGKRRDFSYQNKVSARRLLPSLSHFSQPQILYPSSLNMCTLRRLFLPTPSWANTYWGSFYSLLNNWMAKTVYRIDWLRGGKKIGARKFCFREKPRRRGRREFDYYSVHYETFQWLMGTFGGPLRPRGNLSQLEYAHKCSSMSFRIIVIELLLSSSKYFHRARHAKLRLFTK